MNGIRFRLRDARDTGVVERRAAVAALIALVFGVSLLQSCGNDSFDAPANAETQSLARWNQISIDASGLDHTPSNVGLPHVFGQQVGPCRAARAIAIVHIAMYDVVNAIEGGFQSYTGLGPAQPGTSPIAAIAQAAHDTLSALFPSQSAIFDSALAEDLGRVDSVAARNKGVVLGQTAATAILAMRANDGSSQPEPQVNLGFLCSDQPGFWRQDPISMHPLALGADWQQVTPFVMATAQQFRAPTPPALSSPEYATAYDEVKTLGGDGVITPTTRTQEQTEIGIFWAYDGTPSLCAPPRLYNQIALQIARQRGTEGLDLARLLMLTNVAMADAGIAIWESKYYYQLWRPITGIRESDAGTGPTGLGDGNAATTGDPNFMPLGAPASNLNGPNFTPPFPSYPSGHAGFGGALFQTLRRFYGTDEIAFTFVSDEYNGVTHDNQGNVRPYLPRSFMNLSEAEEENGQSRIYLGIHWSYDKTEGITLGRNVADWVFDHSALPGS